IAGMTYLMLIGRRLLPDRQSGTSAFANPREYTVEMLVEPEGPLVNKTIVEAGLRQLGRLYLVESVREGRIVPAVNSSERLLADDRRVFAGDIEAIVELQRIRGLRAPLGADDAAIARQYPERRLVEVV